MNITRLRELLENLRAKAKPRPLFVLRLDVEMSLGMENSGETTGIVSRRRTNACCELFVEGTGELVALLQEVFASEPSKVGKQDARDSDTEWEAALEQCVTVLWLCDNVPERASDFAESVKGQVEDMQAWIQDKRHVTAAQKTSLDNWQNGLERWIN